MLSVGQVSTRRSRSERDLQKCFATGQVTHSDINGVQDELRVVLVKFRRSKKQIREAINTARGEFLDLKIYGDARGREEQVSAMHENILCRLR